MKDRASAWTADEVDWLKTHFAAQGTDVCMSHLDRSRSNVCKKARQLGLKGTWRRGVNKVLDVPKTCRLYAELKSLKAVAEAMETCEDVVSRVLKEAGVDVRMYSPFNAHEDEIVAIYKEGNVSAKEISDRYGVGYHTLVRNLKKLGVFDPTRHSRFVHSKTLHQCWLERYGKEEADKRWEAYVDKRRANPRRGRESSRYGKPPPRGTGNGWKGWYREHHFRSLRELMFMIDMDAKGVKWATAETKEYVVEYDWLGGPKTYRPDFVVGNVLYEIKPIKLQGSPNVVAKRIAAEAFCAQRGWEYRLIDWEIKVDVIERERVAGRVRFERDYEARFLAYLKAVSRPSRPAE